MTAEFTEPGVAAVVGQLAMHGGRPERFELSRYSVAALVAGVPDAPVALMLPGFTGSKEDFAAILDQLAAGGYQAVAADLPGQYQSSELHDGDVPLPPDAYSINALAADVLELIDALGGQVHLLGHSFGGLVARAAVIASPGRMLSFTQMSSGPADLPPGPRRTLIDYAEPALDAYGQAAVYEAMLAAAASDSKYVAAAPEVQVFLRERFMGTDENSLRGMAAALCSEPDRVAELAAALRCPMLVIYGEGDDAWPAELQAQMASDLGAVEVRIPDAKHSPAAEAPGATADALLAFWDSAAPR